MSTSAMNATIAVAISVGVLAITILIAYFVIMLRSLRRTIDGELRPMLLETKKLVERVNDDVVKIDGILESVDGITKNVRSITKIVSEGIASPVFRVGSVVTGVVIGAAKGWQYIRRRRLKKP
ncbi:MAG: DUF948 domain-containing protein [bacterium]